MAKFTRLEYDELGAAALKTVKQLRPDLTKTETCRLFGRLYSKLLKNNKLQEKI